MSISLSLSSFSLYIKIVFFVCCCWAVGCAIGLMAVWLSVRVSICVSVSVSVCEAVSQEKGKTVTFASDDMVLHYGGQNRHRRKSTPASLNRTPLLHHHHHHHLQQQYHQPSQQQQQQQLVHHHLRSSPPVSAHLRHWLAPGIDTSKKSKLL